ncbi:Uma2 family endonuclease [Streptosporangium sp. NPDC000563]|uniref:Uma2 family endonuclease n=1 Tax=unclassified Streptosporangium TaxID=2632669 RepID=UPI0033300E8B
MTPAPSIRHQRIARRLINAIEACLLDLDLDLDVEGPVNYRLNSDTVFAPDVAVFQRGTDSDLYVEPHEIEILAEVTSTNSNRDRLTKMNRYARTKCEWYWIIDQNTLFIDVYQLDGDLYRQVAAPRYRRHPARPHTARHAQPRNRQHTPNLEASQKPPSLTLWR